MQAETQREWAVVSTEEIIEYLSVPLKRLLDTDSIAVKSISTSIAHSLAASDSILPGKNSILAKIDLLKL